MTRLDECDDLRAEFGAIYLAAANLKATMAKVTIILEALRARPRIAPSIQIPSSTMTRMSSPTAAGLSDNVANATLWIEEVSARQDAHLEAFIADFRYFADDLDQPASFASIDDDNDDDKDEAIHIVLSIDDADIKFEDIAIILTVPFLGGECPLSTPTMLSAYESANIPPQKTACQLKRPHRRPCRRN